VQRQYPPDYVSVETLAYRLDCSVGEIEEFVRRGALPLPVKILGLRRWDFEVVRITITAQNDGRRVKLGRNGQATAESDPYLAGVESGATE
jgi:hypothetical protein